MHPTQTLLAGAAIFLSAAFWGLFWIPLRHFHELGIHALWSTALFLGAPIPLALLATWRYGRIRRETLPSLLALGCGCGVSMVLYATGLTISDVIRVIYLFYLMPIWTTLLSYLFLRQPISKVRWAAVALALTGMCLLLGVENGFPWPRNVGDWCGVAAGVAWAACLVVLRAKALTEHAAHSSANAVAATAAMLCVGCVTALCLAIAIPEQRADAPTWDALSSAAGLALSIGCLVLWPTSVAMLWGAQYLFPGTAALLTMSELIVATLSAGLWLGTSLTPTATVGAFCILVAALADLTAQRHHERFASAP